MLVSLQQVQKERTCRGQNKFVRLNLLPILTGQGHIRQVSIVPQISKGCADNVLKVIPLQAEFFRGRHFAEIIFQVECLLKPLQMNVQSLPFQRKKMELSPNLSNVNMH